MSKIDKISVAITREQHAKIKAAIDRGDYASTSEVIRTALREWELKEEMRRLEGERIARLWDEGIASGPLDALATWSAMHAEARRRWKAEQKKRSRQGRMSYQLSPRAEDDLREIGDYIARR